MISVRVEVGEWFEVGGFVTDPTALSAATAAKDLSGSSVSFVLRTAARPDAPEVTVDDKVVNVIDATKGHIAVGGRVATSGVYYGTISVGSPADGPGWPIKEQFVLRVINAA